MSFGVCGIPKVHKVQHPAASDSLNLKDFLRVVPLVPNADSNAYRYS